MDYHVIIDKHRYSVPHELMKVKLDAGITAATIKDFYKGQRVADRVPKPV